MFANLMTLPHFSVSSAMNLPKSEGEPGEHDLHLPAEQVGQEVLDKLIADGE